MRRYLRVALLSARVQMQHVAVSPFLLGIAVAQPFFIGVTAMYLLRHSPGFEAIYVVVGTGLTGLWSILLFAGAGTLGHEREQGTLELLAASPAPLSIIVGGQMLGNLALASTPMVLSYGIGAWLFGYSLAIHDPLGFGVSTLLALLSLWTMGMLFAPLSLLSPIVQHFLSGLEFPVYILGGFLFPVILLPGWLLPVSYALPPYWAAAALHGTSSGNMQAGDVGTTWLVLLGTSAFTLALAIWLFRVLLARARRQGSLVLV